MSFTIFIPPIIGAIIGYCTNLLAIRMLFRPHHAVYLFGRRLPFTPGLIPKEQARLARKLAEAIGKSILTREVMAQELTPILEKLDEEGPGIIKKLINEHVGKLAGAFLKPDKIYESIKEELLNYLNNDKTSEVGSHNSTASDMVRHIDIVSIIEARVNSFDPEEAEALILSVIRKELGRVMALGGILGFIIGWIPVLADLIG